MRCNVRWFAVYCLPIQICAEYLRGIGKEKKADTADTADGLWTLIPEVGELQDVESSNLGV
jgi:hypothetical protein